MGECLGRLAALSLGGGAAGLLLLAVGRLTRTRYGARWRCVAWALLCLRLIVPVTLLPQPARAELAPIQIQVPALDRPVELRPGPLQEEGEKAQREDLPLAPSVETTPTGSLGAAPSQPVGPELTLAQLLALLWVLGVVGVILWSWAAHRRLLAYLRRWGAPVTDGGILRQYNALGDRLGLDRRPRLLTCPGAAVPMLAGLLRPVLLLPEAPPEGEALEHILLHELIHFRRRHVWLKALALLAAAVHWFNPVVWLIRRQLARDTELACDQEALGLLPAEERAAYGRAILAAARSAYS